MKISKYGIKYFFLMVILIYPIGYFYFFPQARYIYSLGKWIVICLGALAYIKKIYLPSKVTTLIIALEIYLGLITLLRGGNISTWMNYALPNMAMAFLIDYGIKRNPKVVIKSVGIIGLAHLIINAALGDISYNGMNWYWLGLRVRIASYAFPIIAVQTIAFFYFKKNGRYKLSCLLSLVATIGVSVQFFLMEEVATALVSLGVLIIYFVVFNFAGWATRTIALKAWIVEILINIGIVFFGIQSRFAWLIEGVLGKSLTFTGRTTIWNSAFQQGLKHFIIGSGIGTALVFNDNGVTYEHNQLLNMFYSGGLVALALFLIILFICMKSVCHIEHSMFNKIMSAVILACSIEMVTEHPFENALFVVVLVIAYHSSYIQEVLEEYNDINN